MKATHLTAILLLASTSCFANESESAKFCDSMATLSARAVKAKADGADFISFLDKIEGLDIPDDAKAGLKYFVADAFANGISPEHAYSNTYTACMSSKKNK